MIQPNPAHPLVLAAALANCPLDDAERLVLLNYRRVLVWSGGEPLLPKLDELFGILPNTVDEPSKES